MIKINHLARTVVEVGAEREADGAAVGLQKSVEQGHVALFHLPRGKLPLKSFENHLAFGNEQNARCVHVEAVHHQRPAGFGKHLFHNCIGRYRMLLSRN